MMACLALALALTPLALVPPAHAQQQTASQVIERLDTALLDVMRNAVVGYLLPVAPSLARCCQTYDLSQMNAGRSKGTWAGTPPDKRRGWSTCSASSRRNCASRFHGWRRRIQVLGGQPRRRPRPGYADRAASDRPVPIQLLMRRDGSTWKVVGVYLANTISGRARRSNSSVFARGGMDALQGCAERSRRSAGTPALSNRIRGMGARGRGRRVAV
jgi:hypothetical protein